MIWFVFRPRMSGRPDRYRDKQSLDERGAVWRSSFRRTRFFLRSNRSVSNAVDDISSSWGRRSQVSPQSLCKQRTRSAQRSITATSVDQNRWHTFICDYQYFVCNFVFLSKLLNQCENIFYELDVIMSRLLYFC